MNNLRVLQRVVAMDFKIYATPVMNNVRGVREDVVCFVKQSYVQWLGRRSNAVVTVWKLQGGREGIAVKQAPVLCGARCAGG